MLRTYDHAYVFINILTRLCSNLISLVPFGLYTLILYCLPFHTLYLLISEYCNHNYRIPSKPAIKTHCSSSML